VIEAGEQRESTLAARAQARFVQRAEGNWYLGDGETSEQECKVQFEPRRMEPIIRAIAALANNRGGGVFIGVGDPECCVVGMPDTVFQDTDIVRVTDKAKRLLTPTPRHLQNIPGAHCRQMRPSLRQKSTTVARSSNTIQGSKPSLRIRVRRACFTSGSLISSAPSGRR